MTGTAQRHLLVTAQRNYLHSTANLTDTVRRA